MKQVCKFCTNLHTINGRSGCKLGHYVDDELHGRMQMGADCIHDEYLDDQFVAIDELKFEAGKYKKLTSMIADQKEKIGRLNKEGETLRRTTIVLERRLIAVGLEET